MSLCIINGKRYKVTRNNPVKKVCIVCNKSSLDRNFLGKEVMVTRVKGEAVIKGICDKFTCIETYNKEK